MVFRSLVSDRLASHPMVCALTVLCVLSVASVAPGQIPLPVRTEYRASAWLLVCGSDPKIVFDVPVDDERFWSHDTQLALVKSRFVLRAALRRPGISQLHYLREEEDRLTWLKRRLEVRFLGDSGILEFAMSGDDPSQLVELVNAVKDAYMEEVVGVERENELRRKRVLEALYRRNVEEIRKKTEALRELETELGLGPVETAKGPLGTGESLAEIRGRVVRTRTEIRELKRRIDVLKVRLARLPRPVSKANGAAEKPPGAGSQPKAAAAEPPMPAQQRQEIWENAMQGSAPPPDTPRDLLEAITGHLEIETGVLQGDLDAATAELEKAATQAQQQATAAATLETRRTELETLKRVTAEMGLALEKWEVELTTHPRVIVIEQASVPRTGTLRLQLPDWMRPPPGESPSAKPAEDRRPPSKAKD